MSLFSFSQNSGWRSRLRDASFRGVPFLLDDDEGTFGRRVQVHEYPQRDKPFTEDLGRATRRISINAYLVGDDYDEQRNKLIVAIETAGPGTLVHPHYGEMKGSVDGEVRVTHSNAEGRMCRVSFQFVESGELSFPVAGTATAERLGDTCGLFDDAIDSMFSGFSLSGIADFIQNDVIADATEMLETVSEVFDMVDDGISAAMRLMQGDLSVLLMPPSTASDFVHALQNAWRSGDRASSDASDLVTMITTISGVTVGPGLAPKGVWASDSVSTKTRKTLGNLIASAIRTTGISASAEAVTVLPKPGSITHSRMQAGSQTVSHPSLDGAPAQKKKNSIPTWDDLTAVRAAINNSIDSEQLRIKDDQLFLQINALRADVNNDISQRLAQVERTAIRTPPDVLPAIVLAADWYDDAARAGDILSRNAVRHPGFVPVVPLRVPVR